MHHHVLVVPSSSTDLMSQTDDTPSQTNTYLYTRSSISDQVSKTGIYHGVISLGHQISQQETVKLYGFNNHTVSQFPVVKSSSNKFLIDCSL